MLLFYIAVQIKPLTVVIQDAFAHVFWKAHHVATTHHEHGHHHLHDELIEDQSIHEHERSTEKEPAQKYNEEVSVHVLDTFYFGFKNYITDIECNSNLACNISIVYIEIKNPPPQA